MVKRLLVFLSVIALIAVVFFVVFKKSIETYAVDVPYPVLKSAEYFRDARKISKWMTPFVNAQGLEIKPQELILGKDSLQILQQGFIDMKFRRSNGKDSLTYTITAEPLVNQAQITRFLLSYNTTPWKKWTAKNPIVAETFQNMDNFANFMKDPAKVYGYNIQEVLVTDTSFLYSSRTVPSDDFALESKKLFDLLITEAQKKDAGYNGVRIFNWQDNGDGTFSLFAGIGVNKVVITNVDDLVSYKIMPYQKKLLIADFEGPYKDVMKVYAAMEEYKADNKRVTMAIPFHKYISDGYGFADTQVVKMRVSFPVF